MKPLRFCILLSLVVFIVAGCSHNASGSSLSKAPDHGTSFLLQFDRSDFPADADALGALKNVLTKRLAKPGITFFWEPVSTNQVRLVTPIVTDAEIETLKSSLAHAGLLEFRLVHEQSDDLVKQGLGVPGYELLNAKSAMPDGSSKITTFLVKRKPEMTGHYIQSASIDRDPLGQPEIRFTLDAEGTKLFGQITQDNVGRQLALVLDGQLQSAPMIREPITAGTGVISGSFTEQEASDLANCLDAPLPFPITVTVEKKF